MNLQGFVESLGENKEELLGKGAQCQSPAELMHLAGEYGVALDEKGAAELFAAMHPNTGELSDDELDAVAGGFSPNKTIKKGNCVNCGGYVEWTTTNFCMCPYPHCGKNFFMKES